MMHKILDFILENQKFYGLLSNYELVDEKISKNQQNLIVSATVISQLSRYKFLNEILKKIFSENFLHLDINFTFDPELLQMRINVKPTVDKYFTFYGTFYCSNDLDILSHQLHIEYDKSFQVVQKIMDKKIKKCIIDQVNRDILCLKKYIENKYYS